MGKIGTGLGRLPMDEILTPAQVAALLKVHLRTVHNLARRGVIPGRKLGGSWRFRKDAILKMVPGGEEASALNRNRYVDRDD